MFQSLAGSIRILARTINSVPLKLGQTENINHPVNIFLIGIHSMKLQEKEKQKDYSIQEICLSRTYNSKVSVNSRLKAV